MRFARFWQLLGLPLRGVGHFLRGFGDIDKVLIMLRYVMITRCNASRDNSRNSSWVTGPLIAMNLLVLDVFVRLVRWLL